MMVRQRIVKQNRLLFFYSSFYYKDGECSPTLICRRQPNMFDSKKCTLVDKKLQGKTFISTIYYFALNVEPEKKKTNNLPKTTKLFQMLYLEMSRYFLSIERVLEIFKRFFHFRSFPFFFND